ncbi:MAG: hypothetical protein LBF28_03510 [Rickettsiales bacterium]|jgi:ADP-ribose pyrophosphatase YjhB (NUDIX family)|nr:hypothetical protein [Rickettsiales bacterium]
MLAIEYLLTKYKPFDALEKIDLNRLGLFVSEYGDKIYDRTPSQPVITASAVVVNPGFTKILIMRHKLHGFYKQFGGHADGNHNLAAVAESELLEESGAYGKLMDKNPFDLIRWNFPDREKNGIFYPAHDCFDIAFLFVISEAVKISHNKKEVLDTKWEKLETWRDYSDTTNPIYKDNPQNLDYQQRICKKIKIFDRCRK